MSRAAVVCARGERAPEWESNTQDDGTMQALAELSRQIAHDVRTPLNALLGFSSMLSQELFGPIGNERYREYADHIASSAHQTVQAAERTIALAALTPQFPTRSPKSFVNLKSVISEALAEQHPLTTSYILEQISEDLDVWIEQATFHQGLTHLLTGAQNLGCDAPLFVANSERPFVGLEIKIAAEQTDPATPTHQSNACSYGNARIQFLFAQTLFRLSGALVQLVEAGDGSWQFHLQLEASAQTSFLIA